MVRWTLAVAVMAATGLGLGGCASDRSTSSAGTARGAASGGESRVAAIAEPVEVLQVVRGDDKALQRGGVTLVKDEAGLQQLGIQSIEGLSPNWDEQDVVILAMGEQNSGGYWADIRGIQRADGTLYVQGVVNRPGEETAATQALTYPYAAALIAETDATRAQGDYEELVGEALPE